MGKPTTLLLLSLAVFGSVQGPPQSAPQSDPKEWVDLLAADSLNQWARVPLSAVGRLPAGRIDAPSPWRPDAAGGTLVCEGSAAGHEMFRYGPELGDFVLHVEWRFTEVEGEPAYNGGVYARAGADGVVWVQAQTGASGGYLFGNTPVSGTAQRFNLREKMTENRVRPAGEWNTYEIRAVGRSLALWVNGAVTSECADCGLPRGYIGLEAEGYRIEFRNLRLKRVR